MSSERGETPRRSLFTLIGAIPTLLVDLVRDEIESLKNEISGKLKDAGIGIGLLAGAAAFAFFALMVLIAAAILGLATVLPAWLAALIIGVVILIIAAVLALIGIRSVKRGVPPAPTDTIESIKKDVRTIKGTEKNVTS
ncbi:phage holin family protein [Salinibacterium sp. G-O1]|uniref:phage holin family protein n=1 Tax=Salinibacterium sp. G-O1 TaxID=3046208 RepID=UPI0024BBA6C6|nr:phage holin family protein [Salinibacterium sp. G-O1]MDJ0333634.1 phage holin family protein [Salinibacterium sp. G-O1]